MTSYEARFRESLQSVGFSDNVIRATFLVAVGMFIVSTTANAPDELSTLIAQSRFCSAIAVLVFGFLALRSTSPLAGLGRTLFLTGVGVAAALACMYTVLFVSWLTGVRLGVVVLVSGPIGFLAAINILDQTMRPRPSDRNEA